MSLGLSQNKLVARNGTSVSAQLNFSKLSAPQKYPGLQSEAGQPIALGPPPERLPFMCMSRLSSRQWADGNIEHFGQSTLIF